MKIFNKKEKKEDKPKLNPDFLTSSELLEFVKINMNTQLTRLEMALCDQSLKAMLQETNSLISASKVYKDNPKIIKEIQEKLGRLKLEEELEKEKQSQSNQRFNSYKAKMTQFIDRIMVSRKITDKMIDGIDDETGRISYITSQ